ncbi:citrate lyase acyl carrier protein [Parablautia intestinalis]|jgi:citrate lyase acyl carrier protein|uniref:Citrate lyase acyl carrier protein n=1 Tax=Parablautia intestinalis TaxID=2320100 RepID=A0A3A9AA83_9FIRM|nr:citrate lyase acyl carrier protein [Parablautia intestinalis]MCI8615577.1 citrate lyase acyl carrier protein [Lachnospiraceae bacterium]MDE7049237.1 citrate lyase acyl carrier protein [Lachnospiraceae bacterium]RKI88064.1 citrate lyase acyl carrier protein [Parablautia intestinalis]
MEIVKPAIAGTLESSDCQVTVEPGDGEIDFTLKSSVINQYGNQIRKVVFETLESLGVGSVKISIVDKGALDCTIKARVEGAVFRSAGQMEHLPWGGAIRP